MSFPSTFIFFSPFVHLQNITRQPHTLNLISYTSFDSPTFVFLPYLLCANCHTRHSCTLTTSTTHPRLLPHSTPQDLLLVLLLVVDIAVLSTPPSTSTHGHGIDQGHAHKWVCFVALSWSSQLLLSFLCVLWCAPQLTPFSTHTHTEGNGLWCRVAQKSALRERG